MSNSINITAKNFTKYALRTESVLVDPIKNTRLLHSILGVSSELLELHEAVETYIGVNHDETSEQELIRITTKVKLEIGDVLWFMAIFCDSSDKKDVTFDRLLNDVNSYDSLNEQDYYTTSQFLITNVESLVSLYKADMFYGENQDIDPVTYVQAFISILYGITKLITFLDMGFKLKDCLTAVVKKLDKRYPGKIFKISDAISRNTDDEFEAAEKGTQ